MDTKRALIEQAILEYGIHYSIDALAEAALKRAKEDKDDARYWNSLASNLRASIERAMKEDAREDRTT